MSVCYKHICVERVCVSERERLVVYIPTTQKEKI